MLEVSRPRILLARTDVGIWFGDAQGGSTVFVERIANHPTCGYELIHSVIRPVQLASLEVIENLALCRVSLFVHFCRINHWR